MSTQDKLTTRMLAAAETWASHPNAYVEVIATNNGTISEDRVASLSRSGVHIVQLEGVSDHTYPPQKKAFSLLKHMYDTHINSRFVQKKVKSLSYPHQKPYCPPGFLK